MSQWKIQKHVTYKIVDEKTEKVIAEVHGEDNAKSICDKHNDVVSELKWGKEKKG